MDSTGDYMLKEHHAIQSIDKVLDYIEQDIENPDKEESLGDLIDVHTLLTQLKVKQIERSKSVETTDDLYLFSYMAMSSFKVVFGNWEANTQVIDDRVLLYNDIVYLDINRDGGGDTECIVSFYYKANPVVVGEVINTLKDIFGVGLKVSDELFIIDESTGNYLWGDQAIQQHLRNIGGRKVTPIMFFDDDTVGNS